MTDYTHPVLLIEDNPLDLDLAERAFSRCNILNPIQTARDGVEAVGYIDKWSNGEELPVIILLDLKLPRLDGLEVLNRMKHTAISASVPLIVLTSSSDSGDIKKAYELGANSYLIKPLEYEQFIDLVAMIDQYWIKNNRCPG
jgi:CheY-like chemotaxis protein